jgi:hypothetical protein
MNLLRTPETAMDRALVDNLHASRPAADRAAKMMLYGQFVGSWEGTLRYVDPGGVRREATAEVHFGWVLEGRAVQDVWIAPARQGRGPDQPLLMHGSTFRIYDPGTDCWHITWLDPVKQRRDVMVGRAVGDDIVQEYRMEDGRRCQWTFTDITPDSFHWTNRVSADDGATWDVRGEFFLRRRAGW